MIKKILIGIVYTFISIYIIFLTCIAIELLLQMRSKHLINGAIFYYSALITAALTWIFDREYRMEQASKQNQ